MDVVTSILGALDKPQNLIKFVTDRLGHDRRYAIDPGKSETRAWVAAADHVGRRFEENDRVVPGKSRLGQPYSRRTVSRILQCIVRCEIGLNKREPTELFGEKLPA